MGTIGSQSAFCLKFFFEEVAPLRRRISNIMHFVHAVYILDNVYILHFTGCISLMVNCKLQFTMVSKHRKWSQAHFQFQTEEVLYST